MKDKRWFPIKYIEGKRFSILGSPKSSKQKAKSSAEFARSRGWKARIIEDKEMPQKWRYAVFVRRTD